MPHCAINYIIWVIFNHNAEVIRIGEPEINSCNEIKKNWPRKLKEFAYLLHI